MTPRALWGPHQQDGAAGGGGWRKEGALQDVGRKRKARAGSESPLRVLGAHGEEEEGAMDGQEPSGAWPESMG